MLVALRRLCAGWSMGNGLLRCSSLDPKEQQPARFSNRGGDIIMSSIHQVLDQQSHFYLRMQNELFYR
jgi:hypothetical protein